MIKKIKLTQNKFALVDAINYEWLNQWDWVTFKGGRNYYACRKAKMNGKWITLRMHRLILGLEYKDGKTIDHKNKNGLDNRISNLRIINQSVNMRNRRKHINNTSGFPGVRWHKAARKWIAFIGVNNHKIHLGCYSSIMDANEARKQGEIKYWQED